MLQQTFETGIGSLDERLHGGIRPGSIVALTATPTSQSERLLAHLLGTRPTLYLTTQRPAPVVSEDLAAAIPDATQTTVRAVDRYSPFTHLRRLLDELEPESVLVVDTMNPFEADDERELLALLTDIQARLYETGSVAILHCIEGPVVPAHRGTTEYVADVVFDLDTAVYGDAIENRLFVPKVRRGEAITDAIKLDFDGGVTIDTSRDIS
ncbi:RAD55 family ATPase [Halorarius litoreus]|uniref:RAD55 family ATPase n=1 Tax=Halorarius litoreus TaxID=2962676 RepID=UPI0020CBC7CC|nr:transcriptional regulator [Halorarius litoreus]